MDFQGALIKDQGVEFGVVTVKREVALNHATVERIIGMYEAFFGRPVVLVTNDHLGRTVYHGRPDLTRHLAHLPPSTIPWEQFKVM